MIWFPYVLIITFYCEAFHILCKVLYLVGCFFFFPLCLPMVSFFFFFNHVRNSDKLNKTYAVQFLAFSG